MAKMNRRDYLIGMGATAGVIAGTTNFDLFVQDHSELSASQPIQKSSGSSAAADFRSKHIVESGIRRNDLISSEDVKLVFHGLMGLALNSAGECEIGFHSKDNTKHQHRLTIKVYKKQGMVCQELFNQANVPPGAPLALEVSLPELDAVKFYQPEPSEGTWHESDFKWVLNLEGPNWYNANLRPWQPNVYKPVLKVKSGLFYTLMKTTSTFRRQTLGLEPTSGNVIGIGQIAEYVAANIYLKPMGSVTLTVLPGHTIPPLIKTPNVSYEIHFNNDCFAGNDSCRDKFNPFHNDETERNDFYMHRDALNLGTGPRYQLVLAQPGGDSIPDICGRHQRVSDESPCSGVGYGGGGGFPAFP